jgi:hypothetical protein
LKPTNLRLTGYVTEPPMLGRCLRFLSMTSLSVDLLDCKTH